ncbi:MAG TPA: hypothetical protein VNN80_13040 [Polyangiaceae bacterium]|jgi:hypothetical protein|nr:hypothetical protein [Polyangiaceae bacterium]
MFTDCRRAVDNQWSWLPATVLPDQTVSCTGGTLDAPRVQPIEGLSGVRAISYGALQFCAIVGDASVRCWSGNFAAGATTSVPVAGVADAVEFGDGDLLCVRLASGEVSCGGVPVLGIDDAVALSTTSRDGCAVRSDGTVACWREVSGGQSPTAFMLGNLQGVADITLTQSIVDPIARLESGEIFAVSDLSSTATSTQVFIP